MKVESLLFRSEGWNEERLHMIFPVVDAEAILNNPLNKQGGDDLRFWNGSKNGKYSVKLGYLRETKCLDRHHFNQCNQINIGGIFYGS